MFWTHLEDFLFTNLYSPWFRATRLGDEPSACARDGHEPSSPSLTMVRGNCSRALQSGTVGMLSGSCLQEDVTARHPPDVEPPIIGPGDFKTEAVVVSLGAAGPDLPTARQGIVDQPRALVRFSGVPSTHGLWLGVPTQPNAAGVSRRAFQRGCTSFLSSGH